MPERQTSRKKHFMPLTRRWVSKRAGIALALLLTLSGTGCGKSASDPAVVRVGKLDIDRATVAHWERAIKLGAVAPPPFSQPRQSAREQALNFLISAYWLTGEAAQEHITISSESVKQLAKSSSASLLRTRRKSHDATGSANPDTEFIARAILAGRKIREAIINRVPAPTEAEIVDYYKRHHQTLVREETRNTDLIEQLKSRPAALALAKQLGMGQPFASRAIHEKVISQTPGEEERNFDGGLVHAIFAAPLHKLGGPVRYAGNWVIFIVRSVDYGSYVLPADATTVGERLQEARRQDTLRAFRAKYAHEWKARTICHTAYIVSRCSESSETPSGSNSLLGI